MLRELHAGRTLLVTGSTGFLAKAFVAKAVRDLPDLARIVLLIRSRRRPSGQVVSSAERLEREVLGSSAFRRLRGELGDEFDARVKRLVVAVDGDLTRPDLRLSDEAREVVDGVDAIVNSAATVVFDEQLDQAVAINTHGPRHLLELARRRGDIPFLHVSTAYVCGRLSGVVREGQPSLTRTAGDDLAGRAEGTLELERELRELAALVEAAEAESRSPELARRFQRQAGGRGAEGAEEARRAWLKDRLVDAGMDRSRQRGWNDTYTYTKSLGERFLVRDRGSVPVAILRPSIIESGLAEPEPGWIDGLRMADPLFAGFGKGLLRDFPADPGSTIDFIPVDHVVNAMLAGLGRLMTREGRDEARAEVPVYHVATSTANPLGFRQLFQLTRDHYLDQPMAGRDGKPVVPPDWSFVSEQDFVAREVRRKKLLAAAQSALRALPGQAAGRSRQRLARLEAQVDRILYYVRIYRPYCAFPAFFDTTRTEALLRWLPEDERALFDFDPRGFDWATYIQDVHLPGLRRNVLRESLPGPMTHSQATPADEIPAEGASEPGRTLVDLLADSATARPGALALQVKRAGEWRRLSYQDLHEQALGGALFLRQLGVEPGARVLLVSENRPEWVVSYFAILAAGATAVPLDAQTEPARVEAVARITDARLAILSPRCAEALTGPTSFARQLVDEVAGRAVSREEAERRGVPHSVSPETPASLLFTSGTTLEPKGVVLPHRAFLANVASIGEVLGAQPTDRLVSVLPLHHAFEFTAGLLAPLAAGSAITYLETVSAQALVDTMREVQATCLLGVPRLYELMLAGIEKQVAELRGGAGAALGALRGTSRAMAGLGLARASRTLLAPLHAKFGGQVRLMVSGGAALDPRVHDEFHALGFNLVEGYGLTETAPVLTVNPPDRPKSGSVGKPLPGVEVRIQRPGPDGVGEVIVRGANVMAGYYRNPEATAQVLKNGWFHTGDLGRLDDEGYLAITGRLKDLIVTGAGKNVYPDAVEAELKELPGVKECCVVGVRSRAGAGEEVHLVAVLAGEDSESARESVRLEVSRRLERLPAYQRASRIHFWREELPKTRLLKVKRGQVQAALEGTEVTAAAKGADTLNDADPAVRAILALLARLARVPPESLRADQSLGFDLGVDSLMRAEIVAAIETRSGRKVPEEVAKDLSTVRDLGELARAYCAGASSEAHAAEAVRPLAVGQRGNGALPGTAALSRAAAPLVRMAWPAFYGGYLKLRVQGRENLPRTGAYIVAANHQSHLDAGAVLTALGAESRRLHVVAARDYFFDTPWKGSFFSELLNAIPFDRQGDFEPGLAACRAALAAGDPLLIFPEGTRSPDGRLQQFKAGIGVLAVELDVPIVPTRIDGTHAALPKGARVPKPIRVTVTFGRPVSPLELVAQGDLLPYERYRIVTDAVRDGIAALAAAPDHGPRAAPPPA